MNLMTDREYKLAETVKGGGVVPEGYEDLALSSRFFTNGYDDSGGIFKQTANLTPWGENVLLIENIERDERKFMGEFRRTLHGIVQPLFIWHGSLADQKLNGFLYKTWYNAN